MLVNNNETFVQCKEQIQIDGLVIKDRFDVLVKHPLLKVQIDAQIQIVKLLGEYGLTPKALSKLDKTDGTDDNDPLNEFLS
jgi:P27 family predicted phage terminase small subunit